MKKLNFFLNGCSESSPDDGTSTCCQTVMTIIAVGTCLEGEPKEDGSCKQRRVRSYTGPDGYTDPNPYKEGDPETETDIKRHPFTFLSSIKLKNETDFTADMITVTNGKLSDFQVFKRSVADGFTYSCIFTADKAGICTLKIEAGKYTDINGDKNSASDFTYKYKGGDENWMGEFGSLEYLYGKGETDGEV